MRKEDIDVQGKQKKKVGVAHRILSIIGLVICIVMIPLLVINFTLIIKGFVNPDEVPSFLGVKLFVVDSGSMTGKIYIGDLIIVKDTDVSELKKDDIIAFREYKDGNDKDYIIVTHRIVEVTEKNGELAFTTKGDANNSEDLDPVLASEIEGKYDNRIAKLGDLALFLQQPLGMILFVALPLALFIVYDIMRRKLSRRRQNDIEDELEQETLRLKAELEFLKSGQAAQTTQATAQADEADREEASAKQ